MLVKYNEFHGRCAVPGRYTDPALAEWVINQHRRSMDPSRVELRNSTGLCCKPGGAAAPKRYSDELKHFD